MVKVAYNLYATFFLPGVVPQGNMFTIGSASCQIFYNKKSRPCGRLSRRKVPSYHYNALLWLLELEIVLTACRLSQTCTRLRLARRLR